MTGAHAPPHRGTLMTLNLLALAALALAGGV
jgi:hypothetical protein